MKIECILHGVPKGHKVSKTAFAQTVAQFYTTHKVKQQFVCQASPRGAYYHLILSPTFDADNREGGYFGISIYMDAYYTNVDYLYNLMLIAVQKFVMGTILHAQGAGYRYKIADFNECATELKRIEDFFINALQATLLSDQLVGLSAFPQQAKIVQLTWGDYRLDAEVLVWMKQYGTLNFSNEYESAATRNVREKLTKDAVAIKASCEQSIEQIRQSFYAEKEQLRKAHSQEIAQLREQYSQETKRLNEELSRNKRSLQTIRDEKERSSSRVKTLEQQVEKMQTDVKVLQAQVTNAPKLEELRTLLLDLASAFPKPVVKEQQENSMLTKIGNVFKRGLPIILLCCILILQGWQISNTIFAKQNIVTTAEASSDYSRATFVINELGLFTRNMKLHNDYTCTMKNMPDSTKGIWKAEGFTIKQQSNTQCLIQPTRRKAKLGYYVNDVLVKEESYTIKLK